MTPLSPPRVCGGEFEHAVSSLNPKRDQIGCSIMRDEVAQAVKMRLTRFKLQSMASVRESARAFDLAFQNDHGVLIVVRCVDRAEPTDYVALETMIGEGDFDRAALVYCDPASFLADDCAHCCVDELSAMGAALADWRPG
ncbi:MAG: hypothetical protein QM759_08610 [Terricaulis sp.]